MKFVSGLSAAQRAFLEHVYHHGGAHRRWQRAHTILLPASRRLNGPVQLWKKPVTERLLRLVAGMIQLGMIQLGMIQLGR